jgi:hypothetical protein
MKSISNLVLLLLLFIGLQATAQRAKYSKQEFGTAITLGFGKPNEAYDNTLALGLQGDYQYNLAKWFSLRANLGYVYTLPSKRDMYDENGQAVGQINNTSNMLYAGLSPLLYGRFRKVNLFIGATATAGHAWLVTKFDTSNPPDNAVWAKPAFGFSPLLGCIFKTNPSSKKTGELEILLTQFRLNNDETYSILNTTSVVEYRVFAVQIAYRFLL